MNCPNCGNKIKENQKFCNNCGTKITQDNQLQLFLSKHIVTKPTLIIFGILIFLTVSILLLLQYMPFYGGSTYKSIVAIEQAEMTAMQARESLDILIQQDKDLSELIKNKPNSKIDNIFKTFYKNLLLFTGNETEFESKLGYSAIYAEEDVIKNVSFEQVEKTIKSKSGEEYNIYILNIITPQNNIIKMLGDGEGGFVGYINYQYLFENYSEHLTEQWQKYLKLKLKEQNDSEYRAYHVDGIPPSQMVLVDWLIDTEDFIEKYPSFPMIEKLKNDYKTYVSDFLATDYYAFDHYENGFSVLNTDVKKAYEKFLDKANSNTEEYKKIKTHYDELKANNFREIEYTSDETYDDTVNNNEYYTNDKDTSELLANPKDITADKIKFAQNVRSVMKQQDISALAELINYPIEIDNKLINNKEEFVNNMDKQKLFSQEMINNVCNTELFENYQGVMLGNGPNIWFQTFNDELKIYAINL